MNVLFLLCMKSYALRSTSSTSPPTKPMQLLRALNGAIHGLPWPGRCYEGRIIRATTSVVLAITFFHPGKEGKAVKHPWVLGIQAVMVTTTANWYLVVLCIL